MTVSMNCAGLNQNINFKGSHKRTDMGNPYWNTTAGTTAGAVMVIPAAMHYLNFLSKKELTDEQKQLIKDASKEEGMAEFLNKFGINMEKSMEEANSTLKRNKKYAIPFAITASALTLGCGMLVDKIRNDKAKETADFVKQVGVRNAVHQGDDIALSRKGNVYYDSNIGKKYGALLGAICGCATWAMGYIASKKLNAGANIMLNVIPFAIGGLIMGAITDHNTNKAAERKS